MATLTFYICVALFLSLCAFAACGDNPHDGSSFYVRSSRKGCVNVESQRPCPASVLSPDIAMDYDIDVETIDEILSETRRRNASKECITALTTTFCSTLTPRCFVNGSKDFGDGRTACWKANETCPTDTLEEGTCESLKTGLQPFSSCVKPPSLINGSCPQPKYKMPVDKLDLYKRSSQEYEEISYFENLTTARFPNGSQMFSRECISKIKELYCLPFYCSADEQEIIVEYTYEDCRQIFYDCFNTAIEQLSGDEKDDIKDLKAKYIDNCDYYPDAMEESTPPGDTGSGQNISSTPSGQDLSTTHSEQNNVSSTTPGQNMSSTPPGQNMSSTPPGQNTSSTPLGSTESTPPRKETNQLIPSAKPTLFTLLLATSPTTAGAASFQSFSSLLLLLFFLAFVKIV